MQRSFLWFWIGAAGLLLLLPGPAGRLLLDLIGGLTLAVFLVPFLLAGVAVVAWQLLQRRLQHVRFVALPALEARHVLHADILSPVLRLLIRQVFVISMQVRQRLT